MASKRIAGITIELNGDTTGLNKSLKNVDTQLKTTKTNLKDVEKLLKFDPDNVELLEQKQKLLNDAIKLTTERLDKLKDALTDDLPPDQYDALQREIIETQQELDKYQGELEDATKGEEGLGDGAGDAADDVNDLGEETSDAAEETEDANAGWTMAKQILADLVTKGIDLAIEGLKKLGEVMKSAVTDSAEFADEILTLAIKSGLSTDTLQEFAYMAELVDVDLDTVVGSMTKLEKAMISGKDGTGDAADAFHELQVGYQLGNGTLRDTEAVFYDVLEALGEIEDPTEQDRIAMELFGKSFKDLKPLVQLGKDGINKFKQEAHDMGAVLDEDALGKLGDMDDAFQRLDQSGQTLEKQLALAVAPAVTLLAEELTKMAQDPKWQEIFEQLGETLENILPVIGDISGLLGPIFDALSPIFDILGSLLETLAPVISTLLQPLADILAVLLDPIAELVDALMPSLTALVESLATVLEPIGDLLGTTTDLLMPLVESVLPWVTESIQGLADEISITLGSALTGFAQLMEGDFSGAVETWGDGISQMWEKAQKWADKIGPLFKDTFGTLKGYVTDWGGKLSTGFSDIFDNAKDLVKNGLDAIKNFFDNLELKLPHINLPHFSLSGSFSLNPPSVPSLSVSWYAKAMKNGMILDNPTIFGMQDGKFLGGGEAGAEVVAGLGSLMGMIQNAVNNASETNNYGGVTIVVNAAKGQDVNEIAEAVEQRINSKYLRKVAVQR